jgi:hypothetical protein
MLTGDTKEEMSWPRLRHPLHELFRYMEVPSLVVVAPVQQHCGPL